MFLSVLRICEGIGGENKVCGRNGTNESPYVRDIAVLMMSVRKEVMWFPILSHISKRQTKLIWQSLVAFVCNVVYQYMHLVPNMPATPPHPTPSLSKMHTSIIRLLTTDT